MYGSALGAVLGYCWLGGLGACPAIAAAKKRSAWAWFGWAALGGLAALAILVAKPRQQSPARRPNWLAGLGVVVGAFALAGFVAAAEATSPRAAPGTHAAATASVAPRGKTAARTISRSATSSSSEAHRATPASVSAPPPAASSVAHAAAPSSMSESSSPTASSQPAPSASTSATPPEAAAAQVALEMSALQSDLQLLLEDMATENFVLVGDDLPSAQADYADAAAVAARYASLPPASVTGLLVLQLTLPNYKAFLNAVSAVVQDGEAENVQQFQVDLADVAESVRKLQAQFSAFQMLEQGAANAAA